MDRFIVKQSDSDPRKWELYDRENEIVVVWEDRRFNDTQKVTLLNDMKVNALSLAAIMREIGDYLATTHRDKI